MYTWVRSAEHHAESSNAMVSHEIHVWKMYVSNDQIHSKKFYFWGLVKALKSRSTDGKTPLSQLSI